MTVSSRCWPNISITILIQDRRLFEPESGSKGIDPVFLLFLQRYVIRYIMYMIKTYIIKIQSRNLTHDNRLLTVQKMSFQMILKNKNS